MSFCVSVPGADDSWMLFAVIPNSLTSMNDGSLKLPQLLGKTTTGFHRVRTAPHPIYAMPAPPLPAAVVLEDSHLHLVGQTRKSNVPIMISAFDGKRRHTSHSRRHAGVLPIANSVTAERGMAGRNPPSTRLPAKFGPIRDSLDGHGRFRLLAPVESILLP
jgi:hypothetical protein